MKSIRCGSVTLPFILRNSCSFDILILSCFFVISLPSHPPPHPSTQPSNRKCDHMETSRSFLLPLPYSLSQPALFLSSHTKNPHPPGTWTLSPHPQCHSTEGVGTERTPVAVSSSLQFLHYFRRPHSPAYLNPSLGGRVCPPQPVPPRGGVPTLNCGPSFSNYSVSSYSRSISMAFCYCSLHILSLKPAGYPPKPGGEPHRHQCVRTKDTGTGMAE